MKEPWCLATSERDAKAATLVNHYAKRWTNFATAVAKAAVFTAVAAA